MKIIPIFAVLLVAIFTGYCDETNAPAKYKTEDFVGTWKSENSEKGAVLAVMKATLILKSDGHFERKSIVTGTTKQEFTDLGTWRIDGDKFCTTMTNSTEAIEKIKESRTPIVSVSKNEFVTKTSKRTWTWKRAAN
jgi:hypothetical protein